MFDELLEQVEKYYRERGLQWPDTKDSLLWLTTELGELTDAVMRQEAGWIRNNARSSDPREEIGDVVLMALVCARNLGVDPIEMMLEKMNRILKHGNQKQS